MREGASEVFLSYNSRDGAAVDSVAGWLRDSGFRVFLDRWYLIPGKPWTNALTERIERCRAFVVFLGPDGLGQWQQREVAQATARQALDPGFPLIPVLLPGGRPALGFLENTWIDLRLALHDPGSLQALAEAIRGEPPGPELARRIAETRAGICPYRGLRPFREEDAPFFFGREDLTAALVRTVLREPVVGLVGASGVGKSSVVFAGLVATLRQGREHGVWEVLSFHPGVRPLESLAAALLPSLEPGAGETERLERVSGLARRLESGAETLASLEEAILRRQPGTERLLLIVDQWEELYTSAAGERSRERFQELVLTGTAGGSMTLVLTLRGDFYGEAIGYRPLADALQRGLVNVGPMTDPELARCIHEPARRTGLRFEPGLDQRLLTDAASAPGSLPLLEFVLLELWQRRQLGIMVHQAYEDIGKIEGAIATRADDAYRGLSPAEQDLARRLLTRLVRVEASAAPTGQRQPLASFGEPFRPVIESLVDARLLVIRRDEVTGSDQIAVAHEALVRNWRLFQLWLDADRELLLWRQRLARELEKRRIWPDDASVLLRGAELAEAGMWLAARPAELVAEEIRFIEESQAQEAREAAEQEERRRRELETAKRLAEEAELRRQAEEARAQEAEQRASEREQSNQRLRRRAFWLSVAALAALSAAAAAFFFLRESQAESRRARSHAIILSADVLRTTQPEVSAALFAEIPASQDIGSREAIASARRIASSPIPFAVLRGHTGTVEDAAFSPDGREVVSASQDGTVRVWAADGRGDPLVLQHGGRVRAARIHPDGRRILSASADGRIRIWTRDSSKPVEMFLGQGAGRPVLSPDLSHVLAPFNEEGVVRIWSLNDPNAQPIVLPGHEGGVEKAFFSPDGALVATAAKTGPVRLWPVSGGDPIRVSQLTDADVAFSPDKQLIASMGFTGIVQVWRRDGTPVAQFYEDANLVSGVVVHAVGFGPDGWLWTSNQQGTIRVRSAEDRFQSIEKLLQGHSDGVYSLERDPTGNRMVTASMDGTARVWPAKGWAAARVLPHARAARFSPDGSRIVTTAGEMIHVWWSDGSHDSVRLPGGGRAVFSPDGSLLLTLSPEARIRRADGSGVPVVVAAAHEAPFTVAAFSADGKHIALGARDESVRVAPVDGASPPVLLGRHDPAGPRTAGIRDISFSPDGRRVVSASADDTARIWRLDRPGKPVRILRHMSTVTSVAFTPDGTRVLTAAGDGTVRLWDADRPGRELWRFIGHQRAKSPYNRAVNRARLSRDGSRIVTAGDNGTAFLLETATGARIGPPLVHGDDYLIDAAFSRDGRRILTAAMRGTVRIWDTLRPSAPPVVLGPTGDFLVSAELSPDEQFVLAASSRGTVRIWPVDGVGEPLDLAGESFGGLTGAGFSPDGSQIVTTGSDSVRIWRIGWSSLVEYLQSATTACLTPAQRMRYLGEEPGTAQPRFAECETRNGRAVPEPQGDGRIEP